MRGPATADAVYPWRLFGIRDVALGTATLRASDEQRRALVAFGLLCDAADGAAAVIGRRDGSLPPSTTGLVAVPAAAVALGLWLLREDTR